MKNDSRGQNVVKVRGSDCLFDQAELIKMSSFDTAPFFQGTKVTPLTADTDGEEEVRSTASADLKWEMAVNSPHLTEGRKKPLCALPCFDS